MPEEDEDEGTPFGQDDYDSIYLVAVRLQRDCLMHLMMRIRSHPELLLLPFLVRRVTSEDPSEDADKKVSTPLVREYFVGLMYIV